MTTQTVAVRPTDPQDPGQPAPTPKSLNKVGLGERARGIAVRGLVRLAILAVLVLLWQLASGRIFPVFVISSPGQVWTRFGTAFQGGQLFKDLGVTMEECGLGFLIGSIVGSVAGLVFGIYESVARIIAPFANMLYAMPKIMLSPLIVVWFGIGMTMKVTIATLSCLWVVFYNVWNATRRIDTNLLDQFRLMGANGGQVVAGLYLPSATTWLLTSLRIAFPIALIGAVVGEFIAGQSGLGHMALEAGQAYDAAGVIVAVLTVTITAVLIDAVLAAIQSRVALWQGEGERG